MSCALHYFDYWLAFSTALDTYQRTIPVDGMKRIHMKMFLGKKKKKAPTIFNTICTHHSFRPCVWSCMKCIGARGIHTVHMITISVLAGDKTIENDTRTKLKCLQSTVMHKLSFGNRFGWKYMSICFVQQTCFELSFSQTNSMFHKDKVAQFGGSAKVTKIYDSFPKVQRDLIESLYIQSIDMKRPDFRLWFHVYI